MGHDRIDLLKINIEGLELDVLSDVIFKKGIRPKMVLVTYDIWQQGKHKEVKQSIANMEMCGYEVISPKKEVQHVTFLFRDAQW